MGTPFWKNPCNVEKGTLRVLNGLNFEDVKLPEAELANNILSQANVALGSAYEIKNQFISTIFRIEYDKAEELYRERKLCFMPTSQEIPKAPGERLSLTNLKEVQFSNVLPVIYTSFQKVAAGIEILCKNDNYVRFKSVQFHLKHVLCELYTALKEMKINMPRDVVRSIVPKYYRNMTQSMEAKIRDYVIFRDYINTLEYTVEVFNNILQRYPTISFFQTSVSDEVF